MQARVRLRARKRLSTRRKNRLINVPQSAHPRTLRGLNLYLAERRFMFTRPATPPTDRPSSRAARAQMTRSGRRPRRTATPRRTWPDRGVSAQTASHRDNGSGRQPATRPIATPLATRTGLWREHAGHHPRAWSTRAMRMPISRALLDQIGHQAEDADSRKRDRHDRKQRRTRPRRTEGGRSSSRRSINGGDVIDAGPRLDLANDGAEVRENRSASPSVRTANCGLNSENGNPGTC